MILVYIGLTRGLLLLIPPKSIWDWLELLIIPISLAFLGYLYDRSEKETDRRIAEERIQEDRRIAEERTEWEQELRREQSEDEALQAYLAAMTELITDKKLLESEEGSPVRSIARSRTLTVLRQLDGRRRADVVRFLYESGLIDKAETIVSLDNANLTEINLRRPNLLGARLPEANLSGTNLTKALLGETDLARTDLTKAFLLDAHLAGADLREADLTNALLTRAELVRADLRGACLVRAFLRSAILRGADLRGSDLRWADLRGSDLRGADLTGADLREADLSYADLSGVDLRTDILGGDLVSLDVLRGVYRPKTGIIGADLSMADLREADLTGACIDQHTVFPGYPLIDGPACIYIWPHPGRLQSSPQA